MGEEAPPRGAHSPFTGLCSNLEPLVLANCGRYARTTPFEPENPFDDSGRFGSRVKPPTASSVKRATVSHELTLRSEVLKIPVRHPGTCTTRIWHHVGTGPEDIVIVVSHAYGKPLSPRELGMVAACLRLAGVQGVKF